MIVLDTNIISELQGRLHSERILRWLDAYDSEVVFLTAIAMAEIHYGIALLDRGHRQDSLRRTFLQIESEFSGRILSFSQTAAARYGTISAYRQKAGRAMETKDAMIAAICLSHDATLATRNVKDFEGLDLKLVNPFEEA
ncbi:MULTISPECIES: type II toxin-antitoxin system VapC family toxin [unclassified Rhizobium]|uniref:type II toxin-antitoxin system VapC family toxin n=1 Tax=unclassified Rhizobium TaxID=2613769 RepID=UPI00071267BE|nr:MULTISPECIES: type II toxin-antitoxin system VapC family toxin [unclassified Rhizobium]KQS90434.1 recombinase [Rhizobium sp. Leaf386]KQS90663.1 recombinase [Rhizobium sp. Leaf391]KQU10175.1 recombinase [Rhizobium sp. Leaf453]